MIHALTVDGGVAWSRDLKRTEHSPQIATNVSFQSIIMVETTPYRHASARALGIVKPTVAARFKCLQVWMRRDSC